MKPGQTYHEINCKCDFCRVGLTRHPKRDTLDPIQDNCTYGWVLPDRCRYNPRIGCACGAYPPMQWDGEKYVSKEDIREFRNK